MTARLVMQSPERVRPESVTGVVLAGGEATRMGGSDKGLLPVLGRPMVEYVLGAIRPQVASVLISANRNLGAYGRYGVPVVADEQIGFQGPLAGVAAALKAARTAFLVTVPCDSPFVPGDLVRRLGRALESADAELCVAHAGGRIQPVFALLRTGLLGPLLEYLERGERKVDRWFSERRMTTTDFSDAPDAFLNVNTPDDLRDIEKRLKEPAHATR